MARPSAPPAMIAYVCSEAASAPNGAPNGAPSGATNAALRVDGGVVQLAF